MSSYDKIYQVVRQIPRGKVATYGQIAALAGLPRQARLVGYAMHNIPEGSDIPWQRVINAKGEISNYGDDQWVKFHRSLLESEGVVFNDKGKIPLKIFQWLNNQK
ncbi:MAG: MGMT family protein [Candidatus Cloacimonetes bacterium]|nr:MGMT family protein [Candidatus Cloacimonadota bacterium]